MQINSIGYNNSRPAFGCSKCISGRAVIRVLVQKGANVEKATGYINKVAPEVGVSPITGFILTKDASRHRDFIRLLPDTLDLERIAKQLV